LFKEPVNFQTVFDAMKGEPKLTGVLQDSWGLKPDDKGVMQVAHSASIWMATNGILHRDLDPNYARGQWHKDLKVQTGAKGTMAVIAKPSFFGVHIVGGTAEEVCAEALRRYKSWKSESTA
jgi:hypothetical protein